jgi:hypothetical protein
MIVATEMRAVGVILSRALCRNSCAVIQYRVKNSRKATHLRPIRVGPDVDVSERRDEHNMLAIWHIRNRNPGHCLDRAMERMEDGRRDAIEATGLDEETLLGFISL